MLPLPKGVQPAAERARLEGHDGLVRYLEVLHERYQDSLARLEFALRFVPPGDDGTFTFPDGESHPCGSAVSGQRPLRASP